MAGLGYAGWTVYGVWVIWRVAVFWVLAMGGDGEGVGGAGGGGIGEGGGRDMWGRRLCIAEISRRDLAWGGSPHRRASESQGPLIVLI